MESIWNHLKSLEIKWNHQRRTNWFQWISGDFTWFQNHLKSLEIKKSWSHEVSLSPLVEKWRFEELLLWSQSVKPQKQFSRTYSSLKASAIKEKFCKSPFFYRQFLMKTDSSKRKANLPFSSSFGIWGWAPSPINFWLRHYSILPTPKSKNFGRWPHKNLASFDAEFHSEFNTTIFRSNTAKAANPG